MSVHLQRNIEQINKRLLVMGAMVEEIIQEASVSLRDKNKILAQSVIKKDDAIDRQEIEIDEECLKVLALYHPVAEDLRFITTVMKINNDLERMADLAVNMAQRTIHLLDNKTIVVPKSIDAMTDRVLEMARLILRAFIEKDSERAKKVYHMDDSVDEFHKQVIGEVAVIMKDSPDNVELGIQFLWISRNLERIADHITNISEDILFMAEGLSIRHQPWLNEN